MTQLRRTLAFALALLFASAQAHADPIITPRPMMVHWLGQVPVINFSTADFMNAAVTEKLVSGLPQRIVTRIYAYPETGEQPISVSAISCRIVYDLWESVYRVQSQSDKTDRSFVASDLGTVVRSCLDVRTLAIGDGETFARHRGRRVYFAALVELNPLSPDTVQRIRRWLSKSGGGQLRGDAFFGSFVSIFVSQRLGSAEQSMAFRSETFSVPP